MNTWFIYALMSAITSALVAIFGKLGLHHINSTLATTIRSCIMTIFLLIVTFAFYKDQAVQFKFPSYHDLGIIALSGISGATSWLFYFAALKEGIVHEVAAVDRLSIVFVVLFSALFLNEALTLKTSAGALLMALGAWLLV